MFRISSYKFIFLRILQKKHRLHKKGKKIVQTRQEKKKNRLKYSVGLHVHTFITCIMFRWISDIIQKIDYNAKKKKKKKQVANRDACEMFSWYAHKFTGGLKFFDTVSNQKQFGMRLCWSGDYIETGANGVLDSPYSVVKMCTFSVEELKWMLLQVQPKLKELITAIESISDIRCTKILWL